MKSIYRILIFLHAFTGIGAIFGGMAAILNPRQPLGMPVEALKNSPFNNFLIPGIILFTIVGLGNITGTAAILLKSKFQAYISSVFGWGLVIWIVVQLMMIQGVNFLHILFFIIGAIEVILSTIIMFKQSLFPANLMADIYKKISKGI